MKLNKDLLCRIKWNFTNLLLKETQRHSKAFFFSSEKQQTNPNTSHLLSGSI